MIRSFYTLAYFLTFISILASKAQAITLDYIADFNVPTETYVDGVPYGGISGLTYNPTNNSFIAVSDDRSQFAPARWFHLDVQFDQTSLLVIPTGCSNLLRNNGTTFPSGSIDAEGIARHSNGLIYVSSEGDGKAVPRLAPSISIFDSNGRAQSEAIIPQKFLPNPTGKQIRGVINNGAFEGLSLSPSGRFLFALVEYPLAQDDTPADFTKGSLNRGLVFNVDNDGSLSLHREFIYQVESLKKSSPNGQAGGNGVSEILALSDTELLVMERGGEIMPLGLWKTQVSLFKIDLKSATDVNNMESIQGHEIKLAQKELLLDFDNIIPNLSSRFQSIDNLEALAFGPRTKAGEQTLFIASDNNFNLSQRTQFLLFKMLP